MTEQDIHFLSELTTGIADALTAINATLTEMKDNAVERAVHDGDLLEDIRNSIKALVTFRT